MMLTSLDEIPSVGDYLCYPGTDEILRVIPKEDIPEKDIKDIQGLGYNLDKTFFIISVYPRAGDIFLDTEENLAAYQEIETDESTDEEVIKSFIAFRTAERV